MSEAKTQNARKTRGAAASAAPAFQPLAYQKALAADRARFIIALMARQVGKSTACALIAVSDVLQAELVGKRTLWVLLSRGERQSRELARKVRDLAKLVDAARKALQPEYQEIDGSQTELVWPGGSRVIALPANPDTARGYSGNVILDEFAFHADSDAIWTALYPTITRGYRVIVVSTPNGQQNRFYQLWTEALSKSGTWSPHKVTIFDAVDQGLPIDAEELHRGLRDENAWRQEYLCEFVDEATAWLSWELIRRCEDPRSTMQDEYGGGLVYAGWDVARWHDLSVLSVCERVGDVLWLRELVAMKGMEFEAQLASVQRTLGRYQLARLCVDATGIGEMPAEQARRRLRRVEAVKFTGGVKEALAGDLRRVMEDRALRIPADEALRGDLHSVRKTITAAGNARFEGESKGSHADRFWSLALAVHAAGGKGGGRMVLL